MRDLADVLQDPYVPKPYIEFKYRVRALQAVCKHDSPVQIQTCPPRCPLCCAVLGKPPTAQELLTLMGKMQDPYGTNPFKSSGGAFTVRKQVLFRRGPTILAARWIYFYRIGRGGD